MPERTSFYSGPSDVSRGDSDPIAASPRTHHTPFRNTAVPLIFALVVAAAALLGYRGKQAIYAGPPFGPVLGHDYQQVLRAAREISVGINPYEHALAFGRSPNFGEFMTWPAAPYPYPPTVALLAQPMLLLDGATALNVWTIINMLLLAASAVLAAALFSRVRGAAWGARVVALLVLFFCYAPAQIDLKLGNLDILLLFLLLLTLALYRRGSLVAGLTLGLAIALKPILAPMLLFFLWKRDWRTTVTGIAGAGLLTVWSFFRVGWSRLPSYLEVNNLWANGPMLAYPFNQSVKGFALRLFTTNAYTQPVWTLPWLAVVLPLAVAAGALVLWLVLVSHKTAEQRPAIVDVEYSLTLTTVMLMSPLVDDIHFVWALLPLAALLLLAVDAPDRRVSAVIGAAAAVIALYLGLPLLHDVIYSGANAALLQSSLVPARKVLMTGAYLYGLLALYLVVALRLASWRRSGAA